MKILWKALQVGEHFYLRYNSENVFLKVSPTHFQTALYRDSNNHQWYASKSEGDIKFVLEDYVFRVNLLITL